MRMTRKMMAGARAVSALFFLLLLLFGWRPSRDQDTARVEIPSEQSRDHLLHALKLRSQGRRERREGAGRAERQRRTTAERTRRGNMGEQTHTTTAILPAGRQAGTQGHSTFSCSRTG